MNITTITHDRLNEMIEEMPLHEVCEALECSKDELIALLKKMNKQASNSVSILENVESVDCIVYRDGIKGNLNGNFAVIL